MYLVVMRVFGMIDIDMPCIVAETEDKAQEWIDKEMFGSVYNGTGVHKILPIKLYK